MSIEQASTPAEELQPGTEQAQITQVDDERAAATAAEVDPAAPPAVEKAKAEEDAPADPRAARLERISEQGRQHATEELEAAAATMAPAPGEQRQEPAPAPAPAERMVKLRIRGEDVELPESEVIARAQKVTAADDYLTEARDLLKEAKTTVKQPAAAAEPEVKAEKVDRLAQAVELIQVGGDPAEAQALIAEEVQERATAAARDAVQGDKTASMSARFDTDFQQGFADAQAEYPAVMNDPVLAESVFSFNGALQRHLIADFLKSTADEQTRSAFASAGITPEGIAAYSQQDAHALYKDMALKGYPLPPPSMVTKSAAKTFAEKYGSLTPQPAAPTPAPQPALDRTVRKEALQQPQRSTLPRATTQTPPPRTEPQRAASARQELKASRRQGVAVSR